MKKSQILLSGLIIFSLFVSSCRSKEETAAEETESGLQIEDTVVGTGETAEVGDTVEVNYTGWLTDGTKFDSSLDRGQTFSFTIGAGQVIEGWEQGVPGMKVGGTRRLKIPSDMAYGVQGVPGLIPGGAALIFEVVLVSILGS